jgi:group II intron reverse transcriptase/maturase
MVFTSIAHAIDVDFLREAFERVRKDGAPGVDGQTAGEYAMELEGNLRSLLDRFKSGTYWAPPVRRVHIPKGEGTETRPIGVPTFEDKLLQRAVSMVLEAVYEQDFRDCSFGFRPGRSAHQAVDVLDRGLMEIKGGWVLELDIQSFFDTLDHGHLRSFLSRRVRDGVLRRTIDKWLKAGVLEEQRVSYPDLGSPQGGVISPLLANIYLHEVLDVWFEDTVKPRMKGRCFLVRYADDAVIVFEKESDARRVMEVLPERFGKYGLTLHPEKTRLVPFPRPSLFSGPKGSGGGARPGTFDLLGFTFYWGRSRRGYWIVKQKTAKGRLSRALKRVSEWCRRNRHLPVREQHQHLVWKLKGHYAYFGITSNARALSRFRDGVLFIWRKWLSRRSQRAWMNLDRLRQLLARYPLPAPVVVHSIHHRQRSLHLKSRMRSFRTSGSVGGRGG